MKLGQGNAFTGVCDSVHRGGWVSASMHAGMPPPRADTPPPEQTPPGADTPPRSGHHPLPQSRHLLGADTMPRADTTTPPPRSRHPPEQTPPGTKYTPDSPQKQTPAYGQPAAGTHPTGMHSCSSVGFKVKITIVWINQNIIEKIFFIFSRSEIILMISASVWSYSL